MRHILCPIDFSETASNAIEYAINLYGLDSSTYHLFYTYAIPVVTSEVAYAPIEHYEKKGEELLNNAVAEITAKHPGVIIEQHLEFGDLPSAVQKITAAIDFDVVVMGTKGTSGLKEFFFGSNAYDLVDNTELPVLVIPQDCKCKAPSQIIFVSDLKPFKDDTIFNPLKHIMQKYRSNLTVLNMKSNTDSFTVNKELNHFDELFDGLEMSICFDDSENVVDGVEKYVQDYPTDLVVALKRKRNFLQDLFGKSVTRELTFHLKTPMLILHE